MLHAVAASRIYVHSSDNVSWRLNRKIIVCSIKLWSVVAVQSIDREAGTPYILFAVEFCSWFGGDSSGDSFSAGHFFPSGIIENGRRCHCHVTIAGDK
jgi:hypothetical protein